MQCNAMQCNAMICFAAPCQQALLLGIFLNGIAIWGAAPFWDTVSTASSSGADSTLPAPWLYVLPDSVTSTAVGIGWTFDPPGERPPFFVWYRPAQSCSPKSANMQDALAQLCPPPPPPGDAFFSVALLWPF